MNRYLITTADERTWKFDRPVLFLGEWCRFYSRRSIWASLDAIVAEPYGLGPGQKERDLAYVQTLSHCLLEELADSLNIFHETRHSVRYWHITLGHWLQRYVAVMFNRYFTLEQTLASHSVSGTTVLDSSACSLAQPDSLAFIWACNDPVFNSVLYADILRSWGGVKTESTSGPASSMCRLATDEPCGPSRTVASLVQRIVAHAAHRVLPLFSRGRDAVLINTYLPRMTEVEVQIALGQCPQLWRSPRPAPVAPVPSQRRTLCVGAANHEGFERYVRTQLPNLIPTCYLEGYRDLVRQARELGWPSRPKFIFTSNNFDTDEVFKVWTASKVQEGIPYFVGQHGNNYGTMSGNRNWPELVTCDRFFTWGWTNGDLRNVPAFAFKVAGRTVRPKAPIGDGLLLIELPPPHLIWPWDSLHEFRIYQEEQFRFAEALPEPIREMLTVRLHAAFRRFSWSDEQRWRDRAPATRVETGVKSINSLIRESRLVVHSYDSTGILETLATNTPTLCFWHGGLDHLVPDAKPYYELLRDAGILHHTPESAAQAVAKHWSQPRQWWLSKGVQDAREVFCGQYARTVRRPVRTLTRLLTTQAAATAIVDRDPTPTERAQ